jgi:hypothetical protein
MGLADDLATRLAYESLSSLSGMASKVQETIEHNRRAFANQVALIDRQTLQKALYAWKTWRAAKADRRAVLRRALNRIRRGCVSRTFYHWRDHLASQEKSRMQRHKVRPQRRCARRMHMHVCQQECQGAGASDRRAACICMCASRSARVQVQVTVARGLLSRCFFEWRRLADDRWWKKQLLFREREIELLEKLCGGFRNRPYVVLRKRRQRRQLRAWLAEAVRMRRKRLRLARAVLAFRSRQLHAAWNTWVAHTNVRCCCRDACVLCANRRPLPGRTCALSCAQYRSCLRLRVLAYTCAHALRSTAALQSARA